MVIIDHDSLREFSSKIFLAADVPLDEAKWISDCLVLSNLKGVDSHGVQQIPGYIKHIKEGFLKLNAPLTTVKEMASTTFLDAGGGFGYTAARKGMEITIKKATETGVSYTGIRNIHHIGRVGRWAELALGSNMIGIASQPGGMYIAPWGGVERRLPIAPIAMAIPAGNYPPIIVDMSLGPIAGGRNSILSLRGLEVPKGWFIDKKGNPVTKPGIFMSGEAAQLPLGQEGLGYKGMALSMMIDLLAGPLLGYFVQQSHPFSRRGVFLGAINIEAFLTLEEFKEAVDKLITHIKSSKLAPGFDEIMVPGEPEHREMQRRLRDGIPLDDQIFGNILETAKELRVDTSDYIGSPGVREATHPSYILRDRYPK